ncbi:hypothetical protein BDQ17DRAFT_1455635 [Cyathus striatus]|nr:hypothetical protein BDQ17DRAFT_1455635 [Cyathus striatus]
MAAIGAWKDVRGINVWSLRRLRLAVVTALGLDISLVTLLVLGAQASPNKSHVGIAAQHLLHLILPALRVLLLALLLLALFSSRVTYSSVQVEDEEEPIATASSFLLPSEPAAQQSSGLSTGKYGTFRSSHSNIHHSAPVTRAATPAPSTGPDHKTDTKPEIALDPSWTEIWRRIRRLSPYLWPTKSRYLQLLALLCIVVLLLGRVVNLAMPFTLGELVSILEGSSNRSPWIFLFGYVGLRFLQGSGGLSAIRDALWAPVMQFSDREMSQLSFDHLLNLSFAWHTRRKTGEILRVLDRGAAINHTFELILFNIIPTFVDIGIALIIFCFKFEWTLAVVIFFVMFAYVTASVILTRWRTKLRRQMNDRDVVTRGIHTDCLLNYETVKYFGGEDHEGARYSEAIREYQTLEYKVIISLNLLNLVQNFIITLGLLVGSLIVARRVTDGRSKASDFVIFITYLAQLYGPLNQLGYIYRSVNQSLIDTEKLLALLNEPTEVNDKPNAPDLIVNDGEIEFDNVSFSYDGKTTALNGVSFKVPKGSSVALVGESGSGKSTILRLLYRFYDLSEGEGRILIDGQDIRDVTQKSLRQAIGVVPQDSVLFNTSIAYNIGYGKFGASEEEIEAAAKSAQMHDRIISFPDGYETKVGERGVRLSGGEKQRVAIARTLLKNPPILLLDEATSALDTSTEKDIQKALQYLVKGRSSLSIAHRLSTIASADLILVLKDGQIVEQGTHKELIARDGFFASMWADQVSATEDPNASIAGTSIKKEATGYDVDIGVGTEENRDSQDSIVSEPAYEALGTPAADADSAPSEDIKPVIVPGEVVGEVQSDDVPSEPTASATIAFPTTQPDQVSEQAQETSTVSEQLKSLDGFTGTSTDAVPEPVKFPGSDNFSDRPPERSSTPGVTFEANVNAPRTRRQTPNLNQKESGYLRKISSD